MRCYLHVASNDFHHLAEYQANAAHFRILNSAQSVKHSTKITSKRFHQSQSVLCCDIDWRHSEIVHVDDFHINAYWLFTFHLSLSLVFRSSAKTAMAMEGRVRLMCIRMRFESLNLCKERYRSSMSWKKYNVCLCCPAKSFGPTFRILTAFSLFIKSHSLLQASASRNTHIASRNWKNLQFKCCYSKSE